MSKGEEVKNAEKAPEMTEAQIARENGLKRKQAEVELANYKKRIRSSNELKELQVKELELNIAYFKNKKEWMDLAPEMIKLEEREQEIRAKEQAERQQAMKVLKEKSELTSVKKPKLVTVGGGSPRK